MRFMDPKDLGGLHVIGRNDATLGVGNLFRQRKYAVSPANQMS
jgi:hypothetical protein